MATRLSIARLGNALGLFLAALFVLCVVWDGIFPGPAEKPAPSQVLVTHGPEAHAQ